MQFEEYVAARRTRLVEHARELGLADDAATALVDRVLARERRTIERSDDPDPEVREALQDAALGRPRARSSRVRPITGAALVALAVLAALVVVRQVGVEPTPTPRVPQTFALDDAAATAVLEEAGYRVESRDVVRCETPRQVIASEPAPGAEIADGATVILSVAQPPGLSCRPGTGFREEVWQFLRWAAGLGPAPALVAEPTVVVIDDAGTRTASLDPTELSPLRAAVTAVASTPSGFPELTVRNGVTEPPCGTTPPAGYDDLLTLRFDLDSTADGTDPCPLTGYLMSDNGLLATVVLVVPAN